MASFNPKGWKDLSGRMGNVIFSTLRGVPYVKARPEQVKDSRSELQLYYRERMRSTVTFYGIIRQTVLARVWKMTGQQKNRSAYNLFVQANIRAFDGMSLLHELVRFSSGDLYLPNHVRAYREEDKVRLTWENEDVVSDERLKDELWCVVMTGEKEFRVIGPEETKSTREDKTAEIGLPGERGKVHLYCFFGTANREVFSENLHVEL